MLSTDYGSLTMFSCHLNSIMKTSEVSLSLSRSFICAYEGDGYFIMKRWRTIVDLIVS